MIKKSAGCRIIVKKMRDQDLPPFQTLLKQYPRKLLFQVVTSNNTWRFSLETRMMRRLWCLCLRLERQCEVEGQTGGIVGVAIVVMAMAISKQPVHLGGITRRAPLLIYRRGAHSGQSGRGLPLNCWLLINWLIIVVVNVYWLVI